MGGLLRLSQSKKVSFLVRKMKLLSVVKGTLSKFKKSEDSSADNDEVPEDFHRTPAGEYPRNGPKSGIVAIVMFYLSKIITLVGFIMVARAVWFEEDEYQLMTFGVGLCLVTVGVAMMIIVNVLNKCEHDAIVSHLETQVENAKRFRDNTRLLGGTNVPEDKQILVQASNLV